MLVKRTVLAEGTGCRLDRKPSARSAAVQFTWLLLAVSACSSGSSSGGSSTATGGVVAASGAPASGGRTSSGGALAAGGSLPLGATGTTGGENTGAAGPEGGSTGSDRPTGGSAGTRAAGGGAGNKASGGTNGSKATGGNASSGGSARSGGSGGRGTSSDGGRGGSSGNAGGASGAGADSGGGRSGAVIQNDVFWKDTSGTPIYSQGGGVLKVGETYYWYGVKYNGAVSYAAKPSSSNSDTSFAGVTIYSSPDLASWKLENTVTFSNAGSWFGRLGVVYNASTKKYVMVAQGAGGLFFATSDTPTGDFKFDNVQTTLSGIANGSTGDQTMFQDDDGKAYLICSSSSGRSNLYVVPLRASDFLAIEKPTRIFGGVGREGNAMFKYDGRYYFCSSDLHGWNASHSYCISATNILGPYGDEFVLKNTDDDFSHVSQTGFFITVQGSVQSTVIFAGDRWSDFAGNGVGYNQWVPLTFQGTTPEFHSLSEWQLDVHSGTWSVGPNNNYAKNPSFEADRIDVTTPAGWTTTNGKNAKGGYTGRWSWQLSGESSLEQQVNDLPNGSYTLSGWVKGTGASGAALYAKGFGASDKTTSLASAGSSWSKFTVSGITVSNGRCQIGVSATTGSITVDDLVLLEN